MMKYIWLIWGSIWMFTSRCSNDIPTEIVPDPPEFFLGADLSYVNEMEDCGAVYKDTNARAADPYQIFADAGANMARFRLWHDPQWTNYSTLEDVKRGLRRAKNQQFKTLLAFHYSDTWADPHKQQIPRAWTHHLNDLTALSQALYNYTFESLREFHQEGILPDIVQIGNEINSMILQEGEDSQTPMNWERNAMLLQAGIRAVRDFSTQNNSTVAIMLHIAQPENALWWFEDATTAGILDYDWIGLSYYPSWSRYNLDQVGDVFEVLIQRYQKKLMVVETAYPYSLTNQDQANNILGEDALLEGFPPTQAGQLAYLQTLKSKILEAGAYGLLYWEPAWVSTQCQTLWGTGSHWDNATLFDHTGNQNLGMQFFNP